ncbi:response regulator [Paenibacillus sp. Soil787]|uniref:response regulator n=1 Tax=Paenibacillus sp. Soil787 TaxID=1736411 RepID=UPI0007C77DDA|nr:response regulator transcription factor [Paenibacillus sp. Soil787]
MHKIKVLLVEDDAFWKKRLSEDLGAEADIEVVGIVSSREEAIAFFQQSEANVVLLDINLTDNNLDGLDVARDIYRLSTPQRLIRIVMLTSLDEEDVILRSFQNGAVNFITKSSCQDILGAIRDAYAGRSSIHPDSAPVLVREMQLNVLTPMEREVYKLRAKGLSKTQISEKLFKSVNTIKTQLKSIKNKLWSEDHQDK